MCQGCFSDYHYGCIRSFLVFVLTSAPQLKREIKIRQKIYFMFSICTPAAEERERERENTSFRNLPNNDETTVSLPNRAKQLTRFWPLIISIRASFQSPYISQTRFYPLSKHCVHSNEAVKWQRQETQGMVQFRVRARGFQRGAVHCVYEAFVCL